MSLSNGCDSSYTAFAPALATMLPPAWLNGRSVWMSIVAPMPPLGTVQVEGLQTRTEPVTDDVAKVHATAGRLAGSLGGREARTLDEAVAKGEAPYAVTIRQDGTWYPSLVFTVTDWMLTRTERERP